ncbi:MAG: T9SS type A sorting domain-containing protein [Chitinophagaceae bacterium]|nr:T9SS type A sorting domain-containing protein [Chitinophagaceae bacterium]
MKKILLSLIIALGLTQTTQAQVSCDMMNLIVNVSDTGLVKLYHPGHYLTWPQSENVIVWEITDSQGNIIADDTLINNSDFLFYHNIPLTDTMNVTALLTNDSAGIACLIEDKLYWEVTTIGTSVLGRWEFVYDNVGVDVTNTVGIDDIEPTTASVYPNPSSDVINISLNKGQLLKIELFSMTGSLIFKKDLNSQTYALNIGDYPSGVYLVRVFNQNNDIVNTKILKE